MEWREIRRVGNSCGWLVCVSGAHSARLVVFAERAEMGCLQMGAGVLVA